MATNQDNGLRNKAAKTSKSLLWRGIKGLIYFGLGTIALTAVAGGIAATKLDKKLKEFNNGIYNTGFKFVYSIQSSNGIGKKDAEEIIERITEDYKLDLGDILVGFVNLDLKPAKEAWKNYKHPELLTGKMQEDVNFRKVQRDGEKSTIDDYLHDLNESWNDELVGGYHQFLGKLKEAGIDTSAYETTYSRIKTRNEEEADFNRMANDLVGKINVWCANGCDGNKAAVDAGLYFASHVKPTKEMDVKGKTAELSEWISEGLNYRINLLLYLPTSK